MRLTISSLAVFFIVFQWCSHGNAEREDAISKMERVVEIMLSNPEHCGEHGTTESELIPIVKCDDNICNLPDSICQYNFVADHFGCFELSDDCKNLVAEKTKTTKGEKKKKKKGARKGHRKDLVQKALGARNGKKDKEDEHQSAESKENEEKTARPKTRIVKHRINTEHAPNSVKSIPAEKARPTNVGSTNGRSGRGHRKTIPAAIKGNAGTILTRLIAVSSSENEKQRERSKTVNNHTPPRVHTVDDKKNASEEKSPVKTDSNHTPPRAHAHDKILESDSSTDSTPNGKTHSGADRSRALASKIVSNSDSAPVSTKHAHKVGAPRAKSIEQIYVDNKESLRGKLRSSAKPHMDDLHEAIEQQTTQLPSASTDVPEYTGTFIHLPSQPTPAHSRTRTTNTPTNTKRVASRRKTTTAPASVEEENVDNKRLEEVIKRRRLNNSDRVLHGERLLALRPKLDSQQKTHVKQISESIDEDSKKLSAEHKKSEEQSSAEPEPTKTPAEEPKHKTSLKQSSAEPEPTKASEIKEHVFAESKKSKVSEEEEPEDEEEQTSAELEESFAEEEAEFGDFLQSKGKQTTTAKPELEESTKSAPESDGDKLDIATEIIPEKEEGSGEGGDSEKPEALTHLRPVAGGRHRQIDWHKSCCEWATEGQCLTNRAFMLPMCQKSCGSYRCVWDNLDVCEVNVDLTHCFNRSPVLARTESEPEKSEIHSRPQRTRVRVHSSGRSVVLGQRIPLTLRQRAGQRRGIHVALRKVEE